MIEYVDDMVGEIVMLIEWVGLIEKMLVIFIFDNGGLCLWYDYQEVVDDIVMDL